MSYDLATIRRGFGMRRGWAMLVVALAFSLSGCTSTSDAYPNDQARIVDRLADQGIEVRVVSAEETLVSVGWTSYVTIACDACAAGQESSAQRTIRRVVWEQYPHRLELLTVQVSGPDGKNTHEYGRDYLENELGKQEHREDDSNPPFSGGLLAILVVGGIGAIGLFTWSYLVNRGIKRRPPGSETPLEMPQPQPGPTYVPPRQPMPPMRILRTEPAEERWPEPTPPPEPTPVHVAPPRPTTRPTFEELRSNLLDSWEELAERAPGSRRMRGRAEFVDKWLAENSGVSVQDITSARKARNLAAHKGDVINRAAMRAALGTIEKVAERLDPPR